MLKDVLRGVLNICFEKNQSAPEMFFLCGSSQGWLWGRRVERREREGGWHLWLWARTWVSQGHLQSPPPASASTATTAAASQALPGDTELQSAFCPEAATRSLASPSATSPREASSCLRPGAVQGAFRPPHLPQGPAALQSEVFKGGEAPLFIVPAPCHMS